MAMPAPSSALLPAVEVWVEAAAGVGNAWCTWVRVRWSVVQSLWMRVRVRGGGVEVLRWRGVLEGVDVVLEAELVCLGGKEVMQNKRKKSIQNNSRCKAVTWA